MIQQKVQASWLAILLHSVTLKSGLKVTQSHWKCHQLVNWCSFLVFCSTCDPIMQCLDTDDAGDQRRTNRHINSNNYRPRQSVSATYSLHMLHWLPYFRQLWTYRSAVSDGGTGARPNRWLAKRAVLIGTQRSTAGELLRKYWVVEYWPTDTCQEALMIQLFN